MSEQEVYYIYTLDSHDCYGRFTSLADAHAYAGEHYLRSYQILPKPPYESTVVHLVRTHNVGFL